MQRPAIYPVSGPEEKIVQDLIKFLSERSWEVKRTVGNLWVSGLPDLWVGHRAYGHRWIEVKYAPSYSFTPAQVDFFPILCACGDPVWVLTAANQVEYAKLFAKSNWLYWYMKLGAT